MSALKILQITDLHIKPHPGDTMFGLDTEQFFQQTLAYAHQQHGPFDLILLTGDLAQNPCADSYQRINQHLAGYRTHCLCLPGNHDDFDLMQIHLNSEWVHCERQLILKHWLIACLNSQKPASPDGELSAAELNFLAQTLHAHPDIPTLIAVHHHCIPSGSPWLDTMQIKNSAELLALLQKYPQVKAVTFGHIHQALTAQAHGIAILGTPASCFQFTPHSPAFSIDQAAPGYRVFTLSPDGTLHSACQRLPLDMTALDKNADSY